MKPIIFLDMDGPCVDFVAGVCRLFDRNVENTLANWPKTTYWIHERLGISEKEVWDRINAEGADFWLTLQPTPWFFDFLAALRNIAPVHFLSSPSSSPSAPMGKVQWLRHHLGKDFRDFTITPCKEVHARPLALLIDDHVDTCMNFMREGGTAHLFPCPWNPGKGSMIDIVSMAKYWRNDFEKEMPQCPLNRP